MTPTDSLLDRWRSLLPGAPALGDELIACYAEPHRAYHNCTHLTEMLGAVDRLDCYAADPDVVRLAVWFHDAVYQPLRADNEEASARLAEDRLDQTDLAPHRAAEVARLVRLTTSHRAAPDDADGSVLCDADLAILGADTDRYAEYAKGIRAEYGEVDDAAFRSGRGTILAYLLGLDPLFATPLGQEEWQARARKNLSAELDALNR